jgi:hypothetical protein
MRRRGRTGAPPAGGRRSAAVVVAALGLIGWVGIAGTPSWAADRIAGRGGSGDQGGSSRHSRADGGTPDNGPAQFVAGIDGRIATVSSETGRVDRYLTAEQPGGGAEEPTVSPDGRTVWFSRGDGSCAAHIASVPVAGGPEKALPGSGEAGPEGTPLARPGRSQLAWSRADCKDSAEALVVGDLRGLEGHGQIGLVPLAWSRDGDHLLARASDHDELHLLDIAGSGTITDDRVLAVTDRAADCRLQVVGFSPDDNGGYVATRHCGPSSGEARRSLVLLGRDGRVASTPLRLPRGQDFVGSPVFDQKGHSLLYATAPVEAAGTGNGNGSDDVSLWLWRDGDLRRLARPSRYGDPAWLP